MFDYRKEERRFLPQLKPWVSAPQFYMSTEAEIVEALSKQYPDCVIQHPENLDMLGRTAAQIQNNPIPADFLIIPPGYHDDSMAQGHDDGGPRIKKDDPDFEKYIYFYPGSGAFHDTMTNFKTVVHLPADETFSSCTPTQMYSSSDWEGKNQFADAVQRVEKDATSLRLAMQRTKKLLSADTKTLPPNEAEFVKTYQKAITKEHLFSFDHKVKAFGGKVHLDEYEQLFIAEDLAVEALRNNLQADVEDWINKYAPFGGKERFSYLQKKDVSYSQAVFDDASQQPELQKKMNEYAPMRASEEFTH